MELPKESSTGGSAFMAFAKDKVRMVVCLILLVTIGSFLAGTHRLLELAVHFRVQYLAISLLCFLALALLRDLRGSALALVAIGLNAWVVLPCYFSPGPRVQADPKASPLRVMLSNVFTANRDTELVIAMVRREAPDVVILQEVDDRWANALQALDPLFPHSKVISRSDNFGIGIWSRWPLLDVEEIVSGDFAVPSIQPQVEMAGQRVTILATHPVPPASAEGFAERNAQLVSLAARARQTSPPMILVGDLNVTMWSPYYRRLVDDSGLKDARKGFGVQATWPTFLPFMKIPLDHCLVSPTIQVKDFKRGSPVGSDHLPIIADLVIPLKE
jgi:endonuclease/exonuclease/phosphatase (EEP) superfamily protein YafD